MVERSDTLSTNFQAVPENITLSCELRRTGASAIVQAGEFSNSKKFNWTEEQIGLLQTSYHIGYISSMIFGAHFIITGLGLFNGTSLLLAMSALTCFFFPWMTMTFDYGGAVVAQLIFG